MGVLEAVLLITGGVVFLLSFFIPAGRETDAGTKKLMQEEVKKMVADEVEGAKDKIEDIVDETVNYAMEKTERSLERVSNEKIMAVNEYSDTVLEDINKNHKEVMFLYDMLNDKHNNIKTTVSQVEKAVKEVKQSAAETEAVKISEPSYGDEAPGADRKEKKQAARKKSVTEQEHAENGTFAALSPKKLSEKETEQKIIKSVSPEAAGPDISFIKDDHKKGNNNERILQLHKEGKSNVAIAKELGLGVGEVKLVIDLFEGM